jgi:hypothetical protein
MGSSTSQPRKGHEHPHHLPKVGSPDNMEWEHKEHRANVFGTGAKLIVSLLVMMVVVTGFLIITL